LGGIDDLTMATAQYALDGLAQRANSRANNIANMNTPGFRASGVSFEAALSSALQNGSVPADSRITTYAKPGTPDAQGNTVSLENEMVEGVKDSLTYESMVNGFNYKVGVLRQAIGGKP
jgi:flagellar basal-body rod protein FlgB